jgi:hypothetical protein
MAKGPVAAPPKTDTNTKSEKFSVENFASF